MEHQNYPDILSVGCICAEHLEQDYVKPREREKRLKNSVRRRKSWPDRAWKVSAQGNSYIRTDGFNITVFQRRSLWALVITNRETGKNQNSRKRYSTEEAAKAAGFDVLVWAKEHL